MNACVLNIFLFHAGGKEKLLAIPLGVCVCVYVFVELWRGGGLRLPFFLFVGSFGTMYSALNPFSLPHARPLPGSTRSYSVHFL